MCSPATARRIMRDDLSNAALLLVDDEAHIDVIRRSR
jgi:hypothetical protein